MFTACWPCVLYVSLLHILFGLARPHAERPPGCRCPATFLFFLTACAFTYVRHFLRSKVRRENTDRKSFCLHLSYWGTPATPIILGIDRTFFYFFYFSSRNVNHLHGGQRGLCGVWLLRQDFECAGANRDRTTYVFFIK